MELGGLLQFLDRVGGLYQGGTGEAEAWIRTGRAGSCSSYQASVSPVTSPPAAARTSRRREGRPAARNRAICFRVRAEQLPARTAVRPSPGSGAASQSAGRAVVSSGVPKTRAVRSPARRNAAATSVPLVQSSAMRPMRGVMVGLPPRAVRRTALGVRGGRRAEPAPDDRGATPGRRRWP
ncbi:hypothetical protein ACH49_07990 [Streptomyces leeuwenhoekii]|uniref:Uncharacterized protein n=1 Tax=Streptomyces leeuwenhoekii TaxID=1437453 RepID=A0ABR5I2A3_STRLW|nr:hypothetical protein ACH49_07990 [Streptomyces leeuwenhoekii]